MSEVSLEDVLSCLISANEKLDQLLLYEKQAREKEKQQNGWKSHYLAQSWKENNKQLYEAMERAIQCKLVVYEEDGYFNFKCAKGCVGLFFAEAGHTDYKTIARHIKINGSSPAKTTLENGVKNTAPAEWENIKERIFTRK